jgi:hypothetical protein
MAAPFGHASPPVHYHPFREGAFAASGTNIAVLGKLTPDRHRRGEALALRTTNGGRTWQIATTPLNSEGQRNLSIAFVMRSTVSPLVAITPKRKKATTTSR